MDREIKKRGERERGREREIFCHLFKASMFVYNQFHDCLENLYA